MINLVDLSFIAFFLASFSPHLLSSLIRFHAMFMNMQSHSYHFSPQPSLPSFASPKVGHNNS